MKYEIENKMQNEIERNEKKIDTMYKSVAKSAKDFIEADRKTSELKISEMNLLLQFVKEYVRSAEAAQARIEALEKAIDMVDAEDF